LVGVAAQRVELLELVHEEQEALPGAARNAAQNAAQIAGLEYQPLADFALRADVVFDVGGAAHQRSK
jgi:hypothetical protein